MSGLRLEDFPGRVVGNEERGEMHSILDFQSEPKRSQKAFNQDEGERAGRVTSTSGRLHQDPGVCTCMCLCMCACTLEPTPAERPEEDIVPCSVTFTLIFLRLGLPPRTMLVVRKPHTYPCLTFCMCSGDSNSGSHT